MKKKLFIGFVAVVFIGAALVFHNVRRDNRVTTLKTEREGEMWNKSQAEIVRKYEALLKKLSESNYMVVKEKVVRESKESDLTPMEAKEMEIISSALGDDGVSVADGTKVIVQSDKNRHVVTFEFKLPDGVSREEILGPDFSFEVTIDVKTGKVLTRLAGG